MQLATVTLEARYVGRLGVDQSRQSEPAVLLRRIKVIIIIHHYGAVVWLFYAKDLERET